VEIWSYSSTIGYDETCVFWLNLVHYIRDYLFEKDLPTSTSARENQVKNIRKLDPRAMKSMNKQMILSYLLEHRPCSRTDLVTKTGLASSAIWRMIDELLREGLIEQKEYFARTNRRTHQ
jgi:predicted transcriptional regulator